MAELDNLLGSRISLITQQDIRYEGVLFSINQNESSIVLRDVRYFGTEDRPVEKKIAGNEAVLAFVSFPGNEIKDLYVHEGDEAAPKEDKVEENSETKTTNTMPPPPPAQSGPPAVAQSSKTRSAPKQQQQQQQPRQQQQQPRQQQQQPRQQQQRGNSSNNNNNRAKKEAGAVGTGAHLLHLRERTNNAAGGNSSVSLEKTEGAFDFEGGLTSFKKEEVLAEVASEQSGVVQPDSCYKKDNFFDMLSSTSLDDQTGGRRDRMSAGEERVLNQDTFGAIALQQSSRHRYGGRGRGGGRGGGRGRGGGKGQGQGRGGGYKNNNYNNRHYNNNNSRQGQGQGQNGNPVAAK